MIPAFFLYFVDLICRWINIHKGIYLKLNTIGDDEYNTSCIVLKINVSKNFKLYPGCYFLICIPNISSFEWHPISILESKNNKLTFCIKDMGESTWSGKLKKMNEKIIKTVDDLFETQVYLQGPYTTINPEYTKYQSIITIAGGIGVTSVFSILSHINELYYQKKLNKLQKIVFIWIIPHTSLLNYFHKYIV